MGGLLGRSYREGCVLGTGLALAGCEGNHVIERIWYYGCEYSGHSIPRDVARDTTARRVAEVVVSKRLVTSRPPR